MDNEITSIETEGTVETETPTEVETTVTKSDSDDDAASIDDMDDAEFAEFEEKAFEKPTQSTESEDKPKVTESSPEDLDARYKAQMDDKDAKLDKPIVIKLKGKVYEIDSVNELKSLAELGSNATRKYQEIAEHRRTIDFMQDNDLTVDDLQGMFGQTTGQEPMMRTEEDALERSANDIAAEILNGSNAEAFQQMAALLPDGVKTEMSRNPEMLSAFNNDVESGLAQAIMPQVERMMAVKGIPFMQAYVEVGSEYVSKQSQPSQLVPEVVEPKPDAKKQMLKAQPKPKATVSKTGALSSADIDKMTDEEFEKFYETV